MNIIILEDHHFLSEDTVALHGRHIEHLSQILKSKVGDILSVGRVNGLVGKAELIRISADVLELKIIDLSAPPPPTLPVSIILGLPRPRMLQRTLQTIATMGVQELHLIHTQRVERSFWQTPLLKSESIHEQLILGLEQGKATQLPQIVLHPNFKAFMEYQELDLSDTRRKWIAHPGNFARPEQANEATILAIGPEGGFVKDELTQFQERGFTPIQLGERILRVETAIPVLLAKLFT